MKVAERNVGIEKANLAGGVAGAEQQQETPASSTFNFDAKAFVRLLKNQWVCGRISQRVAVESMGAVSGRVLDGIKKRSAIAGPCGASNALGAKRKKTAGDEVFDLQGVLAKSCGVRGVSEKMVVIADFKGPKSEKTVAFGESIQVKQQFFGLTIFTKAAVMQRILFAF